MDCSVKWVIIGYDVITSFLPETGPSSLLRQTTTHIHEGRAMQTFRVTTRYGQPFDLNLRKQDARQLCHPPPFRLQLILMSFDTKFALSKFLFLFKNKQTKMSNLHNACCQRFSLIIHKSFSICQQRYSPQVILLRPEVFTYNTVQENAIERDNITTTGYYIRRGMYTHERAHIYARTHVAQARPQLPNCNGDQVVRVRPSVQVWTFLSPINPTDTMEEEHQSQGCS